MELGLFPRSVQHVSKEGPFNLFSSKNGSNWTFSLIALFDNGRRFSYPLFLLFKLIHLGRDVRTDEVQLMKREWGPAVSITTGRVSTLVFLDQRRLEEEGGFACCQVTGRIRSGGPAVILDNTLDPLAAPNWPLTWEVTANQCTHAHADSG